MSRAHPDARRWTQWRYSTSSATLRTPNTTVGRAPPPCAARAFLSRAEGWDGLPCCAASTHCSTVLAVLAILRDGFVTPLSGILRPDARGAECPAIDQRDGRQCAQQDPYLLHPHRCWPRVPYGRHRCSKTGGGGGKRWRAVRQILARSIACAGRWPMRGPRSFLGFKVLDLRPL